MRLHTCLNVTFTYFDFVLYVDVMSNLNPIAPPRSVVAHTNLIRLFEIAPNVQKISPIVQKVISALVVLWW